MPLLPSVTVTSPMERVGKSSFRIVPTAWPSARVAFVGPVRLTSKVSLPSMTVSPSTGTVTVLLVWPAVKVRTPEVAV